MRPISLAPPPSPLKALGQSAKSADDSRTLTAVRNRFQFRTIRSEENIFPKQPLLPLGPLEHPEAFAAIVTQNDEMRLIFQYVEAIAPTCLPVLVTGETGVGKELIAQATHNLSRREGKLVSVNVAGVDDNLFSDTLFGHKQGGFTGADRDRPGLIEQATGGTLFLDEIGDLSLVSQVKLLRLLQEGKYYPIGADSAKLTDARFIVATNQDLNLMQQKGQFRKDLYYRLRAHNVHVPPLRDRREDIPLLVAHFLERAAAMLGKKRPTPPRELLPLLENYPFAGNIRELEGVIVDLVSRHRSGVLSIAPIRAKLSTSPEELSNEAEEYHSHSPSDRKLLFNDQLPTLKETEKLVIAEALKRCHGIQTLAAQMLGMSRRALNNRLSRIRQ